MKMCESVVVVEDRWGRHATMGPAARQGAAGSMHGRYSCDDG